MGKSYVTRRLGNKVKCSELFNVPLSLLQYIKDMFINEYDNVRSSNHIVHLTETTIGAASE